MTPLLIVSLFSLARTQASVEEPPDETIREVIKSLEASAVLPVGLPRYALFGLDALASFDTCLGRKPASDGGHLELVCGPRSTTVRWPPQTSDEIAVLLTEGLRLLDPARALRADGIKVVARALARAVDDPFTAYLPPELVATVTSSQSPLYSANAGIEVWPRDPTKIREVRRGSDASRVGVEVGDRIVAIDRKRTAGLTLPEIAGKLLGANDSVVRLRLKNADGERDVLVGRTAVREEEIVSVPLEHGLLYLMLPSFKQGSAQRVKQILRDVRPSGVILDLRHNGGGYVPEGIALADLFLRTGPIAGVRTAPGRPTEDYVATDEATDVMEPLVVLVDGASASASELLAMALKERKRAMVIGEPTAGKGSVQRQIYLPDGGVLKVTTAYYVGPRGQRLGDHGVTPDRFLAPAASKTVLEGGDVKRDSWILSAIELLRDARPGAAASRVAGSAGGAGPDP